MQIKGLAVMCARQWLVGCALVLGSSGVAVAASAEIQELSSRVNVDSNRDNGGGGGVSINSIGNHVSGASSNVSPSNTGNLSGEGPHRSANDSASHQRASLSWQSLLPGSIQ